MTIPTIPTDFGNGGVGLVSEGTDGAVTLKTILDAMKTDIETAQADIDGGITAALSDTAPTALGVAATAGVGITASRVDHVHPWAQKRTVVLGHAMTGSADTNGTPNTPIAVGAALPARAIILAVEVVITTAAGGSTSAKCDVGWSGGQDKLIDGLDLFSAPGSYDQNGGDATDALKYPVQAGGKTVTFTVTPDAGKKLSEMTLLVGAINVYFAVPF